MGISAGIIWSKGIKQEGVKKALVVFGIHLVLNFFWSIIFFEMRLLIVALVEIILLLVSILYFTKLFYRITPITAWLQVPYILWVTFATVLNASFVWLN